MPPRKSARAAAAAAVAAAAAATAPLPSPPPAAPPVNTTPLKGLRIVAYGAFTGGVTEQDILAKAADLGAATTLSITKTVTHVICNQTDYDRKAPKLRKPIINRPDDLIFLSEDWLDACEKAGSKVDEAPYAFTQKQDTQANGTANGNANGAANGTVNGKKRAAAGSDDESDADTKPPPQKRAKGVKGAAKDESDDDTKPASNGKGKAAASKPVSSSVKATLEAKVASPVKQKPAKKKKTGAVQIPLDMGCNLVTHSVYIDPTGLAFDASLNQTNSSNNNNKFYRIQNGNDYRTWTRWGRVGELGQSSLLGGGTLPDAMRNFEKKFKDKSGLAWAQRDQPPKSNKYAYIERSYEDSDSEDDDDNASDVKKEEDEDEEEWVPPVSKLPTPIQQLMALIFNQQYMAATMASLNYDANKLPLGKLSKGTILRGFEALKELAELFDDHSLAQSKHSKDYPGAVEMLSNKFYSLIPHSFGRNRPPVIASEAQLKAEIDLMDSLGDLKEAAAIMKAERPKDTVHQFDRQYAALGMEEMSALDHSTAEFKNIAQYLVESKGDTHNANYRVEEIFRIERKGEHDRFEQGEYAKLKKKNKNRRLLWHGSRSTNFGGILSQGLRIAPPEAPVSGYMFGKGVYLADMSSKSANYCASHISNGTALLLLCEAELGIMQELNDSAYNAGDTAAAQGMHSTWGKGKVGPTVWKDASCIHPDLKGVQMPNVDVKPGLTGAPGAWLQYNEFITYSVDSLKLRYLLRVKM